MLSGFSCPNFDSKSNYYFLYVLFNFYFTYEIIGKLIQFAVVRTLNQLEIH